jgi:WD40 repeat protein
MTVLALFALSQRSTAEEERDKAQRGAEVRQSVALAASAKEALLTYDTDLAITLALEANAIDDPPVEARQALAAAVYAPGTRWAIDAQQGPISCVAISPDGRYGLSGGGRPLSLEIRGPELVYPDDLHDYALRLWDLETRTEIRRFEGHTGPVWDCAFSPDGRTILSASSDQTAILWDVATGEMVHRLERHGDTVMGVDFSPDGTQIVTAGRDQSLVLWNVSSGSMIRHCLPEPGIITSDPYWSVDFNPDGQSVVAGEGGLGYPNQGYFSLWNVAECEQIRRIKVDSTVRSVAFSPDGHYVLTGTGEAADPDWGINPANSLMILWNIGTGEEIHRYRHSMTALNSLAFSPDGRTAIAVASDHLIIVWDVETGQVLRYLRGHSSWITDVAFSSDGAHLLTGSQDGTLRWWDLRNGAGLALPNIPGK